MLGLYEFKHMLGENEVFKNTYIVSIVFLNISYEWDSTQQKHSCF